MTLRPAAFVRSPNYVVFFFVFSAILLTIACDRPRNTQDGSPEFIAARIDTIIVRDTLVVVDTLFVNKQVIKKVEVPAEVPAHYEHAWKRRVAEITAGFADEEMCFTGLDSIEAVVALDEDTKDVLSNQRAEDKFELTLRRHGVPLAESTNPYLLLSVDAVWNDSNTIAAYVVEVALIEELVFYRNQRPLRRLVGIWESFSFGFVGKNSARELLLNSIEERAERVANLYLSAN